MESGHCVYSQIWRNVRRHDFVLFVSLHCEAFEPQFDFWRHDFVPFVPLHCEAFEPEIDYSILFDPAALGGWRVHMLRLLLALYNISFQLVCFSSFRVRTVAYCNNVLFFVAYYNTT